MRSLAAGHGGPSLGRGEEQAVTTTSEGRRRRRTGVLPQSLRAWGVTLALLAASFAGGVVVGRWEHRGADSREDGEPALYSDLRPPNLQQAIDELGER